MKVPAPRRLSWSVGGLRLVAGDVAPRRERTRAGESWTLERLFRAHVDDVYRFVRHQLGPAADDSDVEDLTQKVFIAAGRGLAKFRGDSKPSTWLFRISYRIVLRHLQDRRRHRALLDQLEAGALTVVPTASADERLLHQEELRLVWRCLMQIKPPKRMVLLLHRVDGRSGKEIAEILQIKEATVWTRLHHARRELAAALARAGAKEVYDGR